MLGTKPTNHRGLDLFPSCCTINKQTPTNTRLSCDSLTPDDVIKCVEYAAARVGGNGEHLPVSIRTTGN